MIFQSRRSSRLRNINNVGAVRFQSHCKFVQFRFEISCRVAEMAQLSENHFLWNLTAPLGVIGRLNMLRRSQGRKHGSNLERLTYLTFRIAIDLLNESATYYFC